MIAVQFLKEAQEDYDALDGSQKKWVEESVNRLQAIRDKFNQLPKVSPKNRQGEKGAAFSRATSAGAQSDPRT